MSAPNAHEVAEKLRDAAAWLRRAADRVEEGRFQDARNMIEVGVVACAQPMVQTTKLVTTRNSSEHD